MKTLLIFFGLAIILNSAIGQDSLVGCYGRQDSQIKLNADSTFFFFYAVDTYRGWTKGKWKIRRNNIILNPMIIFDTILIKKGGFSIDSLIVSSDYTSERITEPTKKMNYVFQYEQNEKLCPKLLQKKNDILYVLKKKKRQKKKIDNGYYIEAFNPWYTKNKCNY